MPGSEAQVLASEDRIVDFNGDGYEDLAIGAPGEEIGTLEDIGAVNIIYGSHDGLSASNIPDRMLTRDDPDIEGNAQYRDSFGQSMASGDFDGDGFSDLAIGAPKYVLGTNGDAGAVNVIYGSSLGLGGMSAPDGTGREDQFWHQDSENIEDSAEPGDLFGYSMATGDFNADGYSDLAIGAPAENRVADNDGLLHVLYGSPSGLSSTYVPDQLWSQNARDIRDSAEMGDLFGWSLAIGDFNGDFYDDLAIGSRESLVGQQYRAAGAVNVIHGSPVGLSATFVPDQFWHQDIPGIDNTAEQDDYFGEVVAVGNFNGDDYDDLAITAQREDIGSIVDAGIVHVLYGSPTGLQTLSPKDQVWSQNAPGVEGTPESRDELGMALATGDFNNDGYDDLAIGVAQESIRSAQSAGGVNVVYGSSSGLSANSPIKNQFWTQNRPNVEGVSIKSDFMGIALSARDFNSDGYDDLAMGAWGDRIVSVEGNGTGAVNLIHGSPNGLSATFVPDQLWSQSSPDVEDKSEVGDGFGRTLS